MKTTGFILEELENEGRAYQLISEALIEASVPPDAACAALAAHLGTLEIFAIDKGFSKVDAEIVEARKRGQIRARNTLRRVRSESAPTHAPRQNHTDQDNGDGE